MMNKKKVLFVIDTLQGSGAERSLVEIAQHFKRYTPVFAHVYEGNMMVPVLEKAGIKAYSLNIPMEKNFGLAAKKLGEVYEKEQPDLIHSTLFKSDLITRRLKSKYKIPLISSYVNNNYNPLRFENLNFVQSLKMRLVQLYDAVSSRKVDFFISNSETIKEAKAKSTLVNKDKVKVIFRGRDVQKFQTDFDPQKLDALKKSLNVLNKKVLLNVSRLLERKGQMDMIDALPEIIKVHPDIVLLIAGHGNYETKLNRRIKELGLENYVQLLGRRQDVPDLLKIADLFVYPSYFEGLPGSLIEAMLAEKLIVCSDIPENQECVDTETAIFFGRGNVEELTEKVLDSLENQEELKSLGRKARVVAIQKFDIHNIAREYETTYDEVLS
ncbi:glycosyltransferase family 4 protein [Antarcticibacterium sp. 1MA-6-2]|uniref:glycosyltransferase family 4 protein n=1 Tax=Antarcticibacterium sp. 1MA-6-2 TaxID=2908210 RepID=UPI001F18941A|nr:glycosyltransferase family 4 protein [Antarcticibacterium sp. 1MA-6-2]UJH91309.1 glycosyltransferase family 4 protein [Antarcticibacterium sp. 1MA-6-2]